MERGTAKASVSEKNSVSEKAGITEKIDTTVKDMVVQEKAMLSEGNRLAEAIRKYFFCFVLYCFLGWIYEVVLALIYGWGFVNRGFLFGPYLPVYGVGALLLMLCLKKVMAKKRYIGKLPVTPIIIFLLVMLITTVLEYFTGAALWALFHDRWWDYSADFMNLNGFICLKASVRFGFGGLFFLYICQPWFEKIYSGIPEKIRRMLVYTVAAVMVLDFGMVMTRML